MTFRLLLSAALIAGLSTISTAQTIVWSKDVAPILFNKCASCHRTGGIAPFSLLDYTNSFAKSGPIKTAVKSKFMPPWPPDHKFSRLAHERLLSQMEIDVISRWVDEGAAQGDPNLAPPTPTFSTDGDLPGTPDLTTLIPHYTSTATTGDVYRCFVIPSGQSVDKYITAFEAVPGNRPIVHHVLVYADTTGTCASLDAGDPGPGYTSFGGVGTNDAILLGGWVPGTQPIKFPTGFGVRLPKNSDVIIQIHYPAGTNGEVDSTKIKFFFSPTTVRNVSIDPVLNHVMPSVLQGHPLHIPANQTKTYVERLTIPFITSTILGVAPHMHLIGRSMTVFGVTAANDTQKYIRINDWDFHWQGFYMFKKLVKVPPNTTLYASAFYDNTSNNPFNPSNPPQDVNAGEATTDEMMLTYFMYTPYQAGDENIVIDGTDPLSVNNTTTYYQGQLLLAPYPNPATNEVLIKCHFDKPGTASIDMIDIQGRVVKQLARNITVKEGYSVQSYSISDLADGIYTLRMHTTEGVKTEKLVVKR